MFTSKHSLKKIFFSIFMDFLYELIVHVELYVCVSKHVSFKVKMPLMDHEIILKGIIISHQCLYEVQKVLLGNRTNEISGHFER